MGDRIHLDLGVVSRLRVQKGLTLGGVAKECGISPGTLTRVAKGVPVSLGTARRLAGALGVELRKIIRTAEVGGESLVLSSGGDARKSRKALMVG